jgi:hypothetical protein
MLLRVAPDEEENDQKDAGEIEKSRLHDRLSQVDTQGLHVPLPQPPHIEANEDGEERDE